MFVNIHCLLEQGPKCPNNKVTSKHLIGLQGLITSDLNIMMRRLRKTHTHTKKNLNLARECALPRQAADVDKNYEVWKLK